MDFNQLPNEIIKLILLNLSYPYDLDKLCKVNKNINNIIKHHHFIRDICLSKIINYVYADTISDTELKFCDAVIRNISINNAMPLKAIYASSTHHTSSHIVLSVAEHPHTFWLSDGSKTSDTNETLIYKPFFDLSIIRGFMIGFPKLKNEQENYICFAPYSVKLIIKDNFDNIIFSSENFNVLHTSDRQTFYFNNNILVTSDYSFIISLIGKREQIMNLKYYVGVSFFSMLGTCGVQLPFAFKNSKFVNVNLRETIPNIIAVKNQLYYIAGYIAKYKINIPNPELIKNYLDKLSYGETINRIQ